MGQTISTILDLKKAVLAHDEMSIEVFVETMIEEEIIQASSIKNPHALKHGKVHIELDKSGTKSIRMICPFHVTESDGSGRLNLEEQYYKCFNGDCVANKPMNAIDLYMVFKLGVDPGLLSTDDVTKNEFPKAVIELADRLNIVYEFGEKKLTEEQKEAALIAQVRAEFAAIYHDAIFKHKYAKKAIEYMMHERGFAYGEVSFIELVKRYKMGYAPGWSHGYNLIKHKYSDDILIKAGVVRRSTSQQDKGEIRDFLSGGVVLPYFSKGKVNNLYARSLFAKNKDYRHLRLRGNVDIPINFDVAKQFKELIFVEGEFSWLTMVALGYENSLGNRGTNGLNDDHVKHMKSIRDKTNGAKCSIIYLCFDPDDAGQGAIVKTGEKLINEGFDVRVIRLREGDPNDMLQLYKAETKKKMEQLIQEAISYEAFMISHLLHKANLTPQSTNADVLAALKSVQPFVEKTPKLQLAVIADEVVSYLHSSVITLPLLHHVWLGMQPTPKETPKEKENIGLKESSKYFWVFTTDSKERYDALKENGSFKNIVLVQNPTAFVNEIKEHSHIHSILLDGSMQRATVEILFKQLPGFDFKRFVCKSTEQILQSKKEELVGMVKIIEQSSSKVM